MKDSLQLLQKNKHRITKSRRNILTVLKETPQSAQEIFEELKKMHVEVDLVTVYRTLEVCADLGIVNKTKFADNTTRYELSSGEEHHHHLICKDCGSIEDVPLNENSLLSQVQKQSTFKVENHALEFFGLCRTCQ